MPKTVSQLPAAAAADRNAVVAADNAAATLTEKVTLGQIADLSAYHLSASTTNATPTVLSGDSLTLQNGEAWQFEVKVVAVNRKTAATKVWSIRGGIRRTFGGATALVGTLDTQTTGSIGGGSLAVTAGPSGPVITATGLASTAVDWTATVLTSEETTTQQALVGGCTDPDAGNYSASADFDNGSCTYPAVPSSAALEPIAYEGEIESLEVTVGEAVLYPAFDPAIHDYCVSTSAAYLGNVSYSIVINEGDPITGTEVAGRTLQINDGTSYYYVRLLPSDVVVGSVAYGPATGYVPGYYLAARDMFSGGPNYHIYDQNGVPVWFGRAPGTTPVSLHLAGGPNRIITNPLDGEPRALAQLNSQSVSRSERNLVASSAYGQLNWELHESIELSSPTARKGNLIAVAYSDGFYIQEQSPTSELIWEWHSKEYFTSQDIEYYHLNSVDVHPVTGNLLVSLRNCSAVLCIEYATKNVLWVLQGDPSPSYGTLQAVAIPEKTSETVWLSLSGEPEEDGFQYVGPRAQHDARWLSDSLAITAGNAVISLYDNQSDFAHGFTSTGAGPYARGVIYEINAATGSAIHRSSIFSELGRSPYTGNYAVVQDSGVISHAVHFSTQHPAVVEYVGGVSSAKQKVFALDLSGELYRVVKVPLASFRLDNLRATCGVDLASGELPSPGAGGGGTLLLMHFDGTNGGTAFSDSSANDVQFSHTGTATTSSAESVFGGASMRTGSNGYITSTGEDIADISGGDWTVECWLRWVSGQAFFVFLKNGAGTGFSLFYDGDLKWNDGAAASSVSGSLPSGQWAHVAVVRSNGTVSMYVDGVLQSSQATNANAGPYQAYVGRYSMPSIWTNDFYIDELRIVGGTAVYTDEFTPPSSPFTS